MPKERLGIIVLAFAGVLALGFGFWSLGKNIKAPFLLKPGTKTAANIAEDQYKDTDKDGLPDFYERTFYNTSPYLEDTDSDGKSDKEEIDAGADPNCPEGKTCGEIFEAPKSELEFPAPPDFGLSNLSGETNSAAPKLSIEEIKNLLRAGGISEEMLAKLDDQTIMELYEEAVRKSGQ